MGILSGFFSEDLAIDLGTVNTIVYAPTQGVVLNEPSVLALHKYSGEVLSVGSQALKLLGREPNDTEVHRPIRRGAIDNFEISQLFLRALISRVQHNDHPKRSHLVIGVPGSSTPLERRSVKDAARDAKAGRVDLIDEGLAAGMGAGLDFEDEQAHLVGQCQHFLNAVIQRRRVATGKIGTGRSAGLIIRPGCWATAPQAPRRA